MTEIWPIIGTFLQDALFPFLKDVVFPLLATLFGGWVFLKTREWSAKNDRVIENTEKTKDLVAANTELTENIKRDSEYLKKKLLSATAATSYAKGVVRGKQEAIDERTAQDDLDAAEAELDGKQNTSGRLP